MTDEKTSFLIKKQLPEFVRDEYPLFISFLEAYYEYLDSVSLNVGRTIKNISDVDATLDLFEDQFFNEFAQFIPRDSAINSEFLLKNMMNLLLAKGSEKSYKLLFRLLYNKDVEIIYPKQSVLIASDGKWVRENVLRLTEDVYSEYTSDGYTTIYYLPQIFEISDVSIYVDGVLLTSGYTIRKEYRKIIFTTSPTINSNIKIYYANFNMNMIGNRKLIGAVTGASAIVETIGRKKSVGVNYYQAFINDKLLIGTFGNGEKILTDIIDESDNIIPLTLQSFSDLETINIIDGGSSYNVGDPVVIRGTAIKDAIAVVGSVASGKVEELTLLDGGAGFKINNTVEAIGYSNTFFDAYVQTVDSTGVFSSNTITINVDLISDYESVLISASDYGFPSSNIISGENVDSIISESLTSNTISNLGEITSITITTSDILSSANPVFNTIPETITGNLKLNHLGIIGKINVVNGGTAYEIGDVIQFVHDTSQSGYGANAQVANVTATGIINQVKINNGGLLYNKNDFPSLDVISANGTNAILEIVSIMGDNESIISRSQNVAVGQILDIKVLYSGISYANVPGIDLTGYGDGNALANASIRNSLIKLPGKWITSDGMLSSNENKLQGRDYYIDFSYVLKSKVEFTKYKHLLKNLLHPAGTINYSIYEIDEYLPINTNPTIVSSNSKCVSGSVNVTNNSVIVIGNETYFNIANSLNIFTVGSTILIADEQKTIINITSNTQFNVDSVFTATSNNNLIKVL